MAVAGRKVNGGPSCAFVIEEEIATLVPTGSKTGRKRRLMTCPGVVLELLGIDDARREARVSQRYVRCWAAQRGPPI